ncbi:KPN_02809 family neutral zinc metallopeptidase [Prosthecodimorpha staleyi]|uniref:Zinc metallopeptidase n=1 Tax=Prosthecodimorpha staleyi TaxID=2840188 RepID=A0A947GIZ8_9HYPH|nr:neutral zinc metallopeptidase [Prosthecodimorpha staleyi]MBT9290629.1 zinc metallopeptidase [Prosthecodimorpha staleyi]
MRWEGREESSNIEDRRGGGGGFDTGGGMGGGGLGGGGFGLPINLGGGGIGTILVILVISWVLGINPLTLLSGQSIGPGGSQFERQTRTAPPPSGARRDEQTRFVSVVLRDTELRWKQLLPQQAGDLVRAASGKPYEEPRLVLFNGSTRSPCGEASAATGPFYCPGDRKVYIDLAFYDQLKTRFKAPGDFAQAYVIAHEIGHHIQNLIGVLPEFNRRRQQVSEREANRLSVRVELQADCFAGVWAYHAQKERDFIEAGDIEEALNAASRIGDDSIQRTIQGYSVPDSFTHGSSEQRVRWFKTGFESGRMASCDTFRGNI